MDLFANHDIDSIQQIWIPHSRDASMTVANMVVQEQLLRSIRQARSS
jgi:hypothetical protein